MNADCKGKIVVALGGNALQRKGGEVMLSASHSRKPASLTDSLPPSDPLTE